MMLIPIIRNYHWYLVAIDFTKKVTAVFDSLESRETAGRKAPDRPKTHEAIMTWLIGDHSPFRERPVGGRGGGGGEAGVRREQEEDVLREEERVGRAEDDVLSSTREEDLRRSQVSAEEWDLWERPRLFNCETDALDAQL